MQHVCPAPIFNFNRHSCCLLSIRHSNITFVKISPFALLLQKCNKLYLLDLTQYYDANYGYSSVAFPQQAKLNCLYIYARIVVVGFLLLLLLVTEPVVHSMVRGSILVAVHVVVAVPVVLVLAVVVDVLHICNIVLNSVAIVQHKMPLP